MLTDTDVLTHTDMLTYTGMLVHGLRESAPGGNDVQAL